MITLHNAESLVDGADVRFDCPACGKADSQGLLGEQVDAVKLLYLIPLFRLRATAVKCGECEANIACLAPSQAAVQMTPDELAKNLRWGASGAAKIATLIAFFTCLIPFVGLVTSGVAAVMTRGTRGWPGALTMLSTILAITISLCVGLVMVLPS